ncbi:MAG TPA: hypothetical protein VFQ61_15345, partial [Polyangiaceae bacterium]|nr:hypothetical protein [Polyangiaceae bacterium]
MRRSVLLVGLLASTVACESSSGDGAGGQGGATTGGSSGGIASMGGTASGGSATKGGASNGGTASSGASSGGTSTGGNSSGGMSVTSAGGASSGGASSGGVQGALGGREAGTGGRQTSSGGTTSQAGAGGKVGGQSGGAAGGSGSSTSCVGKAWTTADPTKAGPFQVVADKNVGPLAGVVPDPIYGDKQQRFNVYRPSNLEQSGYCHPILIWANGYRDNPEQNPPDCVVNSSSNQWCGQYSPMLKHLASHGFVVVASLSTATAEGNPLPTIAGLDWILKQSEDSSSPYYHHLDTANIGQLGHSYGAMSTCMSASEPRYKALAAICGTRALSGVHTPMLFFCG